MAPTTQSNTNAAACDCLQYPSLALALFNGTIPGISQKMAKPAAIIATSELRFAIITIPLQVKFTRKLACDEKYLVKAITATSTC